MAQKCLLKRRTKMAVPKKRTSKSKKNLRKTIWKKKALKQSTQAYSLANWALKKVRSEKEIASSDSSSET